MNKGKKKKSRMFRSVNHTFNPIVGCSHFCSYCWARMLARKKRYKKICDDCLNFKVHPHFDRKIKAGKVILVCSMGDLFCKECPNNYIIRVLNKLCEYPGKTFILCTKNPIRYKKFLKLIPDNCILGTTIETNRDILVKPLTKAPLPSERYKAMTKLNYKRKFLSIEPIIDFDLSILLKWVSKIKPEICEIGYNNYTTFQLPDPPLKKTMELIARIRKLGILTYEKTIRKAWYEQIRCR